MKNSIDNIIRDGYSLRIGDYFGEAWALIKPHLGIFIGFTLLSGIASAMLSIVPGAGLLLSPIVAGASLLAFRAADKGEYVNLDTFFSIFKTNHVGNLILATLVSAFMIILGFICLILPGIYLAVGYVFVTPLIMFSDEKDFWKNMENSRKIIGRNWWGVFGWLIVVGIVAFFATIFTLIIGLVIIIPWLQAVSYVAYKDVVGFEEEEMSITDHLVE
jgi:uncharacterized membrane protein